MKMIKSVVLLFAGLFLLHFSYAQASPEKENIKVYGNCGMCKKTIEANAKNAGATAAEWSSKTKQLLVNYDPSVTSGAKIQQAIAKAGYDTQDFTADDNAYQNLEECCQYERKSVAAKENK
ncbi:MAG: cation transporter [Ginsengibacter sp.]